MATVNFKFRKELLNENASLSYCYQCATCSGGCPVALKTEGDYNPRKIIGLEGYGIEVVERVPIETKPHQENIEYLKTKVKKMGHLLSIKSGE